MSSENNIPNNPTINSESLKPFQKFCISIGAMPSSYQTAMSYQELLLWLCNYLENTVIPAINNNAEALTELQNLYVELKNYVDNYFNNLDIQQEIGNKLDEMAENGTLDEIFSKYMNKSLIKVFKNLDELLNNNGLVSGNICKTLYFDDNDNGGSYYLISEKNNTENGITIFNTSNGLQANLVLSNIMYTSQFAISPNSSSIDISQKLNFINNLHFVKNLIFDIGTYKISNTVTFNRDINIDFNNSIINSDCVNDTFIFTGNLIDTTNISEEYLPKNDFNIKVVSYINFKPNYLIAIKSDTNYNFERDYYKKGIVTLINSINENTIKINNNIPFNIEAGSKVEIYDGIEVNLKNLKLNGINDLSFVNNSNTTSYQNFGIKLKYCKNSSLDNIIIDNFLFNIYEIECYNITNNKLMTKHSLPNNYSNQYSYGLALIACNLINTLNSNFNSGTHGVTYGNDNNSCETSYSLNFDNCLFASEIENYGFGCHHNAIDINISNSIINGAMFCNNTTLKNCKIFTNNYIALYYGDNDKFYNYIFENCDFKYSDNVEESLYITRAPFQTTNILKNIINNIILDNCNDVYLYTDELSENITSNNTPTINNIIIKNSKNIEVRHLNHTINNLIYQNNISLNNKNIIDLESKVNSLIVSNSKISARYNTILLSDTDNALIENTEFVEIGETDNSINIQNANTNICFINVKAPLSNSRGVEFSNGCNLSIINSILHIRTNLNLLEGKNLSIINSLIKRNDNQSLTNIIQNSNGLHFLQNISDDGVLTLSKIT